MTEGIVDMKQLKITLLVLLSLITALAFSLPKTITIGLDNTNAPPYFYHGANKILGTNIRKIESAFSQLGIKVKWKLLSTKKFAAALEKGKVDFVYPANPKSITLKKNKALYFSTPVQTTNYAFFQVNNNEKIAKSKNPKVGIMNYAKLDDKINLNKKDYSNSKKILEDLQKQKIDIALVNVNVSNYLIQHILSKKIPISKNEQLPTITTRYELATSKHKPLLQKLDKALKAARGNQA